MTGFALRAMSGMLALFYMIFAFGSCQAQSTNPMPVDAQQQTIPLGQSNETVTIRILQSNKEIGLQLQEAADLYMQSNRGVSIQIQTVSGRAEYLNVLRSKLPAENQVELFHIFGYQDVMEFRDNLEDLSDLQWIDRAMEGTLDAVTDSAGIYGVPYGIEAVGLLANRNIFEQAGIPLGAIDTFDDLTEAFADLREQIESGELLEQFPNLQAVTELPALDSAFLGGLMSDLILTDAFESSQQAATARTVNAPMSEAAEEYIRLMARYSSSRQDWSRLNSISLSQQIENGLATGRVAVIHQNISVYDRIIRMNPDLGGRLALLPIPLGEDDASIRITIPAYWAINAAASQEVRDQARDFLTWLYRSEAGSSLVASRFSAVSAYRDTARDTGVSVHDSMLTLIDQGDAKPSFEAEFPRTWGSEVFAPNLRSWLDDELEWDEMIASNASGWIDLR